MPPHLDVWTDTDNQFAYVWDLGAGKVIRLPRPLFVERFALNFGLLSRSIARNARPSAPAQRLWGLVVVLGFFIASVLTLSLLATTFAVQTVFIPSRSMEPTLEVGDRVIVSKLTPGVFDLRRGDVVVFSDPGGWTTSDVPAAPRDRDMAAIADTAHEAALSSSRTQPTGERLIKRVVGLPGDRVVCCNTEDRLLVNGAVVDESAYLPAAARPSWSNFDVTVPANELWVMGDNRANSADSREHPTANHAGFVPIDLVVGRAEGVFWPTSRLSGLSAPSVLKGVDSPSTP